MWFITHAAMPSKVKTATTILIVERNGELRPSEISKYGQLELAQKCKYKTPSGFDVRAEWAYSGPDADKFIVELWAREDGNAGQENKYEFPPPVDTLLFFGACALVAKDMTPQHHIIPLTLEKWDKMYNFLFGGFDTLANCDDDDDDDDELDSIPSSRKTKDGYLKDGFVVDEEDDEDEEDEDEDDEDEDEDEDEDGDDAETNYDEETTSENEYETDDSEESEEPHKPELAKKKCATSKKPKKRVTKDEIVTPSFELVEEAYEYADD
jgi:hypothetical protein